MQKIILIVISSLLLWSCGDYKGSYWKSDHYYDMGMDYYGDGDELAEVLCDRDRLTIETFSKAGMTKTELLDKLGYILNKGILYIKVDTREQGGKLTQEQLEELLQFQKEWMSGDYIRFERFVYPVWMVYSADEAQSLQINGYWKGEGWYTHTPTCQTKYWDEDKDFSKIFIKKYIQTLVPRIMTNNDGYDLD